jgi:hypothetical protein
MTDMDKLIDKIKKLLALSKSSNEHEAALALEKAQALLAEHNLSMDTVMETASPNESKVGEIKTQKRYPSRPWLRMLAGAVAHLYFCKAFFRSEKRGSHKYDRHYFVGTKANSTVAALMFEYLAATIQRIELEHADRIYPDDKKRHSAFRNAFRLACVDRLSERIAQRIEDSKRGKAQSSVGSNLPALANMYTNLQRQNQKYLDETLGRLNIVTVKGRARSNDGTVYGRKAGDEISLDQQIGHQQTTTAKIGG